MARNKYGFEITSPTENELKKTLNLEYVEPFLEKYGGFEGIYLTHLDPLTQVFHSSKRFDLKSKNGLAGILWKGKIIPFGESNNLDSNIVEISFKLPSKEEIKGSITDCGGTPRIYGITLKV